MRENGDCQQFEIVGNAVIAAVEKCACLRSALEHQRAARRDAELKLFAVTRAMHDLDSVVVQARIDANLRDLMLHCENVV